MREHSPNAERLYSPSIRVEPKMIRWGVGRPRVRWAGRGGRLDEGRKYLPLDV